MIRGPLDFTEWLFKAKTIDLSMGRRLTIRMRVNSSLQESDRNDFRLLEPIFADEDKKRPGLYREFLMCWDGYADYLSRIRATVEATEEYTFSGEHEGVQIRGTGGKRLINAAYLYWKTSGFDPLGLFSEDDLPVIEATFEPVPQAETIEEFVEWLDEVLDVIDRQRSAADDPVRQFWHSSRQDA